jgi:hypothetical protein
VRGTVVAAVGGSGLIAGRRFKETVRTGALAKGALALLTMS